MAKCNHVIFPACGCVDEGDPEPSPHDWLASVSPEDAVFILAELDAIAARRSLAEFVRLSWDVVEPSTKLDWNWHHQLVCDVLQGMFEDWQRAGTDAKFVQRHRNVIFNLCPGSLKSRIIAVCFNAWVWLHCPGFKLICLSVNEQAAHRDARYTRELIRSNWYQSSFRPDWKLRDDQDAVSNFANTKGGERLSKASGSEIVGLRGDALILDDLNNPRESESSKVRREVNELWTVNQRSRVNDLNRSLRIGVQQRTHAADWTGHVLANEVTENWLHVCLPAEYEASRKCVTPWGYDPRTVEGESIHSTRLSKSVLEAERQIMRDKYVGQYQQRPALAEGGKIKKEWFGFCRLEDDDTGRFAYNGRPRPSGTDNPDNPKEAYVIRRATFQRGWDLDWMVISVDPANKKTEGGSNWGILLMAGKEGRRFILDDRTCKGDYLDILKILRDMISLWKPDRILIEDKAAGPTLLVALKRAMMEGELSSNVMIEPLSPDAKGDKEDRLDAVKSYIVNGQVYLLDGCTWGEDFVDEMTLFPNGINSDRVDCLTQCLAHHMATETILPDW